MWGLDRCIMHGGLGKEGLEQLRENLKQMVEYIDPNFLLVRGHQILAASLANIIDDAGRYKPVSEWPPEVWPAIASVKVLNWNADPKDGKTEQVVEVRLVDQGRYQELMMKHAGMLMDKLELSGKVQHEHAVGQVFLDAMLEGQERETKMLVERGAAAKELPTLPAACPHCGKPLPRVVEGEVVSDYSEQKARGLNAGAGRAHRLVAQAQPLKLASRAQHAQRWGVAPGNSGAQLSDVHARLGRGRLTRASMRDAVGGLVSGWAVRPAVLPLKRGVMTTHSP